MNYFPIASYSLALGIILVAWCKLIRAQNKNIVSFTKEPELYLFVFLATALCIVLIVKEFLR